MSDMALRKPAAAGRANIAKKHRGETSDAMRVLGQTAAVAGISGALLLSLKAMVLIAPAVLPGGSGLDALGRPAPSVASVDDLAAPVAIGRVVEDAFGAPAAPRVSGVSERNGASVDRGSQNNGGGRSTPVNNGNGSNGSNGSNGGSNNGGGTNTPAVKETGAVGGVVGTLGGVLDGVLPGTSDTLKETTAPVTGTVDNLTKSLGLDKTLGDVTGSLGRTEKKSTPASSSSSKEPGLLDPVTNLTGSLLGNSGSSKSLLGGLGL